MGDLNTFMKRLQNLKTSNTNKANILADKIADKGVQIASEKYGGEKVVVSKIPATQGKSSVVAKGEKVSFMEFGTGVMGKGTYDKSKLPTEIITFESPVGQPQSTKGWQYNYRKEQGQTDRDWKGFEAKAQMFHTAQQLRQEIPQIVAQEIDQGDDNV